MKQVVSDKIKLLLKENNKSRYQLAQILDVTQQSVARYYHGKALPSMEHLVMIAKYFGVTTDYLLGLDDHTSDKAKKLSQSLYLNFKQLSQDDIAMIEYLLSKAKNKL